MLTDKDKLIELLETEIECNKDGHGDCSMCEYKYADKKCTRHISELTADYLLANGVIMSPCNDVINLLKQCSELQAENERLKKVNDSLDIIGKFYSELKADIYKEVEEKIEGLTWYHIGKRGKLVMGANGETDIPLYKAEDIYNLLNELIGKSAE